MTLVEHHLFDGLASLTVEVGELGVLGLDLGNGGRGGGTGGGERRGEERGRRVDVRGLVASVLGFGGAFGPAGPFRNGTVDGESNSFTPFSDLFLSPPFPGGGTGTRQEEGRGRHLVEVH